MKKKVTPLLVLAAFAVILTVSCRKDPDTSVTTQSIAFSVPAGWPSPVYSFKDNPLSRDGFELGRKLFYDARLSRDNSTSCGSCHQSFAGFAQADHIVSHGVDGKTGNRNSPALANLAWHTTFFWDGGVNHLEQQPINPIQNPVEMDLKIDSVVARVGRDADYRQRFSAAFGDETVNTQRIFRALAQFMAMMVSANSKYDFFTRNEPGGILTGSEQAGMEVFDQHCASCHKAPLFSDFSFRNNGLPPSSINDSGRAHITRDPADLYRFKVPTLRNLKYTAPYMHDGRFSTLSQVLDHYDHGIQSSATLDPLLKGGIQLTAQQRQDLLAFLNTLNDETFVKDKRFTETP